jgi:N-acyl-D-aspartate/D-glutamate deacylase
MTLLIRNVQIAGGDRAGEAGTDVFINNDRISAIGSFPNKKADVILDGQGALLTPGFIDSNTESDHYLTLFTDPGQEDFLRQGVTTMFGGMCGSSLAPLLYGSLESIREWGDPDSVNVNWHAMAEFLAALDRRPGGLNFGTLVGHSTVRRAIIGDAPRDLTKNEIDVFSRTLETALAEGAFGLSTGLGYVHAKKTPHAELRTLTEIVRKHRGVYATHLRHAGAGIKESVEETIKLAKETGVSTLISHFVPIIGAEKEYEEALALIEALPADMELHFDIHPSPNSLIPIHTFLPEWTQAGRLDVMNANINDTWLLPRIKKDMPSVNENDFIVVQAPGNEVLVGRSLAEIAAIYEVNDMRDALLRLMQALRLKGTVLYRNLNADLIARAIASPRSLIASNAPNVAGRHMSSERNTATFSAFLSMIEKNKAMPFETALAKITTAPAKKFGLSDRGYIKEGAIADLVCFRGDEVKFTVVNGRVAEKESEFQSVFAGKALRHRPPKRPATA